MLINRKYLIILPAVAFACLLIAGLVVSVVSLKHATPAEWADLKNMDNILSGESTRRFTKLLNKHFVLGPAFNQIERGILWNLTGDLGPSVRPGCDDWLFLTDELEPHPDRLKSAEFRAALAEKLGRRLKERGIKLLVVVVPDKSRIEKAHLCHINRSGLFDGRVASWLAGLNAQGLATLDLTPTLSALPGERYYHTDTHWNEAGANAAARAVAADLNEHQWATLAQDGAVALNSALTERPGDLVHLAGLDGLPGFLRPKVEMAHVTVVPPVATDDLFGDAGVATIALIGTSYSRNSNFAPFLEHYLGEAVANQARDGGDFSGAATAYFGGVTFRSFTPGVVIWEIPERVIEMPVKEAERKWMDTLLKAKL